MVRFSLTRGHLRYLKALVLVCPLVVFQANADFVNTVDSTNPLAFWTLDSVNGTSQVNGYTTTYQNGAGEVSTTTGSPSSQAASLDGDNSNPQYISTSLSGGIPGTGSIMAWVNLADLPSDLGQYFYVAGESQGGNDFDLQFQTDNNLYFYTGAGENTEYAISDPTSLVNNWNMIVATYDSSSGFRDIYFDGQLVATVTGSIDSNTKTNQFNIGYSTVFGNRDFDGEIDDVAVWNSALTSDQVAALYNAGLGSQTSTPEPATLLLAGAGMVAVGLIRRRRSRS